MKESDESALSLPLFKHDDEDEDEDDDDDDDESTLEKIFARRNIILKSLFFFFVSFCENTKQNKFEEERNQSVVTSYQTVSSLVSLLRALNGTPY